MINKYKLKGDHPVLKRIDWKAGNKEDMHQKLTILLEAGYQITVEADKSVENRFDTDDKSLASENSVADFIS